MPTIQVRIDDQTKKASTALFDQLGMSMSEAISLFLRQSIMRGGIPFTLTVPEKQKTNTEVRLNFKGRDFVLDYNFEEPDSVFILSRRDGKLFVKDCDLANIRETMEHF